MTVKKREGKKAKGRREVRMRASVGGHETGALSFLRGTTDLMRRTPLQKKGPRASNTLFID